MTERTCIPDGNLGLLLDVPLEITAELGTCKMRVSEILKLGNGSVVQLDRAIGAPIDVFVNDHCIARGEIVAIDENLGIRITELVKQFPPVSH